MTNLDGFLLIDKPAGWTSFDVVAKVRGVWRTELKGQGLSPKKAKVGHTGTLDPFATGLMIIMLGDYCKRAQEFTKMDKTYQVEMELGKVSSTGDPEGKITKQPALEITEKELIDVLDSFVGESLQTPPAFSAIKVDGQRAYKLARQGKEVKIEPRKITIYSIEDIDYHHPKINFTVSVSSGTYIRSLVEDIGQKLGTGAYTTALRRTNIGAYDISTASSPNDLTLVKIEQGLQLTD